MIDKNAVIAAALSLGIASPALAQTASEPASEPSELQQRACHERFGPDDEVGAANLLTPAMAQEAASLVTEGKVYSLGVETNAETPAYGTRKFQLVVMPGAAGGATTGDTKLVSNDDVIVGYAGIGSQLDGLGHIGIDNMYYNCNPGSEIVAAAGLKKLGIENVPNLVTRGVVLDMTDHFGVDMLEAGTAFNREEIQAQAEKQGVEIGEGDVVLFHTGWLEVADDRERFLKGEPGLGVDGARWLVEQNVVAVGSDSWGLEVVPFEEGTGVFEVHQVLLTENGVYILENMNVGPLVEDGVSEFMFVLGHAKLTGGVQSIINPTAIR